MGNYREKMAAEVKTEDIKSIEDLENAFKNVCKYIETAQTEEAFIIRGLNIYALEIENCLGKLYDADINYEVILDIENNFDIIKVYVSVYDDMKSKISERNINRDVSEAIQSVTGLKPYIFIEKKDNIKSEIERKVIITDRRKNAQN